ncbi:MAG: 30S ribosomal protein S17 [Deltaproteobacteria bacterium]|jgi:small subunit ribosomal protein S17|nr:30S ribosomal protein S17 [Deltaproteobacteria bacterium]
MIMHAQRKTRTGTVVSNAMQNTAVVAVQRRVQHPKYRKFLTRRTRYQAHDANNECEVGDTVVITECRPLSRHKRWRVSKIVERAVKL